VSIAQPPDHRIPFGFARDTIVQPLLNSVFGFLTRFACGYRSEGNQAGIHPRRKDLPVSTRSAQPNWQDVGKEEDLRDSVVLAQVQRIIAELRSHGGRAVRESPEVEVEFSPLPNDLKADP
jgi:hypothetical protein